MNKILFVDDDPLVLQGLNRMFHNMRHEWEMRFASSGAQALEMMAQNAADVVVSDMRMPNMTGAQLLNQIMQQYPRTIRFILSGYADMEMILQCVGRTHQFLAKPCDGEVLRQAVRQALDMDLYINNDALKSVVSRLSKVPSLPTLYSKILRELNSQEADLEKVGNTIAQDPGMTAKMLQLVNSAFFGLSRRVADPTEAVVQLGLNTVKALVLAIHVFSEFESRCVFKPEMQKLHHHSLSTALTARRIAELERQDRSIIGESFTAGLLHDIGEFVLLANLPDGYAEAKARAQRKGISRVEAERLVFGVSHAEVGGYLLGLWGLPSPIVHAAVFHHEPRKCQMRTFGSLAAAHVADVLEEDNPLCRREVDLEYLKQLGVVERMPAWREAFQESSQSRLS